MIPPNRNKRLKLIGISAVAIILGAGLLFSALSENTQFFYDPSEIMAPEFSAQSKEIRIGGLVKDGSIIKGEALDVTFDVKDFDPPFTDAVRVHYSGILPDLFREGQGVVITGEVTERGQIKASEVLAKHDENYRPKM